MFALVTGFPLFIGLVKGSISFLCLISVTPIMLLLSERSHVRCLGTFIKYYKISQLIHTQIIAN